MLILRPTRKLTQLAPEPLSPGEVSDTALGDWYANRLVVDRKPLVLLVSSTSLLAILAPSKPLRDLPWRMPDLVAARLRRLGIAPILIQAEVDAMHPVRIAKPEDRSILGFLVEFGKSVPYYIDIGTAHHVESLAFAEDQLARSPWHAGKSSRTVWPIDRARELLADRWGRAIPSRPAP